MRKEKKNYEIVKCVTSGDGFIAGELYAMLGWNNGHHILREDEYGNIHEFVAHDGGYGVGDLNSQEDTGAPSFKRSIMRW